MSDKDTVDASAAPSSLSGVRSALAGRYELLEEVGRGGMGAVYKARHAKLGHTVAVKVCNPGGDRQRFVREGQLAAAIDHPHVVRVYDFDELPDGRVLLAMQWVSGGTLADRAKPDAPPVPEADAVRWMCDVCAGMQAAAERGVIHRDLKPSNVLIDEAGRARVADFGLAVTEHHDLTASGALMGTPHYMAPEQAEDPRAADTRSDVYSFGATFYRVLTGRTPFEGPSHFSILFKHKTEPLVSPIAHNPSLSPRVAACLERCMAKNPTERFQSFREVVARLAPAAGAGAADPWAADADTSEVRRHLDHYRERRALYLAGAQLPEPDRYDLPGGRVLSVGFGNLAETRVDALVSSDDEYLSMGGAVSFAAQAASGRLPQLYAGVAGALCRAAGPGYAEAAQRLAPVRHGRAVVTPAGTLPARFVFHAVTISLKNRLLPSRDIIHELLDSCLYHADTLDVHSIAFPLLGTGTGMLSREVCLDTMVRHLLRKLASGLTSVRDARIVIYKP
jgi:serine/threonine protein kinase